MLFARSLLTIAIATALGLAGGAFAQPAATLPLASLEDPSGRRWPLAELAGVPVVLVAADRVGSEQAIAWGERLAAAFPRHLATWTEPGKVAVVSVADLRAVPRLARPMARWMVARLVADESARAARSGPPLLLDWDGVVARAGGVQAAPGEATVVLFAGDGSVAARLHGAPDEDSVRAAASAIRTVLGAEGGLAP